MEVDTLRNRLYLLSKNGDIFTLTFTQLGNSWQLEGEMKLLTNVILSDHRDIDEVDMHYDNITNFMLYLKTK